MSQLAVVEVAQAIRIRNPAGAAQTAEVAVDVITGILLAEAFVDELIDICERDRNQDVKRQMVRNLLIQACG